MTDVLETLAQLAVLVFVISSMLSMGLSLTMKQIIDPLFELEGLDVRA